MEEDGWYKVLFMRDYKARPIENPAPLPTSTLEDVRAVVHGLTPGLYLSSDLYARHQQILEGQGREPGSRQGFGRMLREYGLLRRTRRGAAAWLIQ